MNGLGRAAQLLIACWSGVWACGSAVQLPHAAFVAEIEGTLVRLTAADQVCVLCRASTAALATARCASSRYHCPACLRTGAIQLMALHLLQDIHGGAGNCPLCRQPLPLAGLYLFARASRARALSQKPDTEHVALNM